MKLSTIITPRSENVSFLRSRLLILFSLLCLLQIGCQSEPELPADGNHGEWITLTDQQMIKGPHNDGDSLMVQIDEEPVVFRLYYVDTVETSNQAAERRAAQVEAMGIESEKEARGMALAYAAKQATAAWLREPFDIITRWERVDPNSDNPSYRAFVKTSQGDLGELLVAEGLAKVKGGPARVAHPDGRTIETQLHAYRQLEIQARDHRKGYWANSSSIERPAGADSWAATDLTGIKRQVGNQIQVGGRINRIGQTSGGGITFLNFAGVDRGGFVVIVRKRNMDELQQSIDGFPESLEDKNVLVSGKIDLYRGTPQIVLRDPEQLSFLP